MMTPPPAAPPSTPVTKPRPALFRALGKAEPPLEITVDGEVCQRVEIYKHDSWAATSLYSGKCGLVIAKFNRQQRIGIISMRWLGYWLARHEATLLSRLQALPNIPRLLGPVYIKGRLASHAVARAYIPGHPMRDKDVLPTTFFDELQSTLKEVHTRHIAYMDLHKRENIIVGDDGRPYLIDFQVSYLLPSGWWARLTPLPWILKLFQKSDDYHCIKHIIRHSTMAPAEAKAKLTAARPLWIKLHRLVAVPIREMRRRLLVLLGIRQGKGRVETEVFTEDGLRQPATELHHAT
jgi:hypothetical protein